MFTSSMFTSNMMQGKNSLVLVTLAAVIGNGGTINIHFSRLLVTVHKCDKR